MPEPLSHPPTEEEVEDLRTRVSARVWVSYEDDAIELLLCNAEGERLVRFAVQPAPGCRWAEVPVVEAIDAFAGSLDQLTDLFASTPDTTPQAILLQLEEHAALVVERHPGVTIARREICSLEPGDWLG